MDGQLGPGRGDDLLLLGSCKLSKNGLCDCSGGLDREGVHEHMRGGSHDGRLARELPRRDVETRYED